MTVLITLTLAGADTGPYDLFSDVDGFTTPFETSIQRVSLLAGYVSANVPDLATVIKLLSKGNCASFINIVIQEPTTTTTSSSSTTSTTTTVGLQTCIEYTFGTFSVFNQTIKYRDCDNIFQSLNIISNGVDLAQITLCALEDSYSVSSETFLISNNGECNPSPTTTTTTTVLPACIEYSAEAGLVISEIEYLDCDGIQQTQMFDPNQVVIFCALEGSISQINGSVVISILGPC